MNHFTIRYGNLKQSFYNSLFIKKKLIQYELAFSRQVKYNWLVSSRRNISIINKNDLCFLLIDLMFTPSKQL